MLALAGIRTHLTSVWNVMGAHFDHLTLSQQGKSAPCQIVVMESYLSDVLIISNPPSSALRDDIDIKTISNMFNIRYVQQNFPGFNRFVPFPLFRNI